VKLKRGETIWSPKVPTNMLCILAKGQKPPENREEFMFQQVKILDRLAAEASARDLADAKDLLDFLPREYRMDLPTPVLKTSEGRSALILNPKMDGMKMQEWFQEAAEYLPYSGPMEDPKDLVDQVEEMDLVSMVENWIA
jgi:hypothetical protein